MKIIYLILSFQIFVLHSNSEAITVNEIINNTSVASPQIDAHRTYWAELAFETNVGLMESGLRVGVGKRWEFLGADLRFSSGSTKYGQIKGRVDYNQSTGSSYHSATLGTEMERVRDDSDSWKFIKIEPGISVEGKLFPLWLPRLSERGRFGISFGNFKDVVNDLSFTSYLFNFEAGFIYQMGEDSPWSIEACFFWNSGNLMLNVADTNTSFPSDRHLPVNWLGSSFGLQYSF